MHQHVNKPRFRKYDRVQRSSVSLVLCRERRFVCSAVNKPIYGKHGIVYNFSAFLANVNMRYTSLFVRLSSDANKVVLID